MTDPNNISAERGESAKLDPLEQPAIELVRFTMYRGLDILPYDRPMPFGYRVEPWCEPLMPAFAAAIAVAFSDSPDIEIYPRLGSREGCLDLLRDVVDLPDFLSGASWLIFFNREPCAFIITSQTKDRGIGQIKIAGVAPRHRKIKVGSCLVNKAMWALRDRRYAHAMVKTNRSNRSAVLFFRTLGFQVKSSQEYL